MVKARTTAVLGAETSSPNLFFISIAASPSRLCGSHRDRLPQLSQQTSPQIASILVAETPAMADEIVWQIINREQFLLCNFFG